MKRKTTLKSLAELTAESLSAPEAPQEKTKPPDPQGRPEAPQKMRSDFPPVPEVQGYHNWGINE